MTEQEKCVHCGREWRSHSPLLGHDFAPTALRGPSGNGPAKDKEQAEGQEALSTEIERLKAENASLLESLREARDLAEDFEDRYEAAEKEIAQAREEREKAFATAEDYEAQVRAAGQRNTELTETLQWVRRLPMAKKYRDRIEATLQEAAKGRAPTCLNCGKEITPGWLLVQMNDGRLGFLCEQCRPDPSRAQPRTAARAALHDEERSAPPEGKKP